MAQANRYRLKLSKLDFVSLVDNPAQPNATTLLIKRDQRVSVGQRADLVEATARYVKASDELGLAFFWAFTSKVDDEDHFDLQGDTVDEDFVKAAMEFMEGGGAVDEMHDYEATKARVVFAMPMTPEIAKAYGIATSTTGLMVAIKCAPEQLAKLKDGTYTGVSIAGLGTREPLAAKRAPVKKQVSLYTDEVDGHQHQLDICEDGSVWCSWATSAGAETTHSHAVSRDASGAVVILADSGHTHGLAEGQPAVVVVPEGAVVVTNVEMRAPTTNHGAMKQRAGESTRSGAGRNVALMSTNDTQIADLTKRLERADRIVKMTGAHKTYFDSLAGDDAEVFLAKTVSEREAVVKAAAEADAPIWIGEVTKVAVRVRDGELALQLAKQNESNAAALAKREEEIEKAATSDFAKSFNGLPGDDAAHFALAKAVRAIDDEAVRAKVHATLKGAHAIAKGRATPAGADGNPSTIDESTGSASDQLDTLTAKYMTEKSVDRPTARVEILKTVEGRRLYAASIGRA